MSIVGSEQWMYSSGREFYDFSLEQSLRFEDGDSAYLSRTPASAGNRKTWTLSFWVKFSTIKTQTLFATRTNTTPFGEIRFESDGGFFFYGYSVGYQYRFDSSAVYRDTSAWYNFVFLMDTTQSTQANRTKIYVNGTQLTAFDNVIYPSQNLDTNVNNSVPHDFGYDVNSSVQAFDGYLAEVNFIDGQALDATSFGETKSGIWVPKDPTGLTYGTNGFRLAFADGAAIGDDTSGNTNDWTTNNLVASDVVLDSPTNNFAVLNRTLPDSHFNTDHLSEGNLFYNEGQGNNGNGRPTATIGVTSGKWYWEVQVPSQQNSRAIGFTRTDNIGKGNVTLHGSGFTSANSVVGIDLVDDTIDQVDKSGTHTQHASGLTGMSNNDIFGISVDLDGGTFQMYRNGSTYGSSYSLDDLSDWQTHGMTPTASGDTYQAYRFNFGQDSTFANLRAAGGNADENGLGDFAHPVPSGFLSLCSANLPKGAIDTLADETPEDYFNTLLFTGNGGTNAVTGVGFQPDLIWSKSRNSSYSHSLFDFIRGVNSRLKSNSTDGETTDTGLGSFDSDGFTMINANNNNSGEPFVTWNWKAGGTGVSNTDGSITSTVSVGATSQQNWFSIVDFTGAGSAGTVGHGLGVVPSFIVYKRRNAGGDNWVVYHNGISNSENGGIYLNLLNVWNSDGSLWNNTAPTSSVFSVGTYGGASGENRIAYCFANAEGLCRAGSYIGNGSSTDGTFVYTGFRPSFLLVKITSISNQIWLLLDSKRGSENVISETLEANNSNAESNNDRVDFVSNGFKWRNNYQNQNNSGNTFIYLAIASQGFKYANAR